MFKSLEIRLRSYDANGSLTNATTNGQTTTYAYNLRNEVRTMVTSSQTTSYVYDCSGNLVKEVAGATTTVYLIDASNLTGYAQVLEEKTTGGALNVSYILGPTIIGQAKSSTAPGRLANDDLTYILTDGHGSTRLLITAAQAIVAHYDYDAFGDILLNTFTNTATTVIQYSGQWFDAKLQMQYLRARWYRMATDSFITMDTYMGNDADPLSLHKYLYADADAVNYFDSSGYSASLDAAALGTAVHKAISVDFSRKLGEDIGVSGVSIVTLLDKLGPLTNYVAPITSRFPDLIDIKDKEVFEIKPATTRQIAAGYVQLTAYIILLNNLDPKKGWHAGDAATYTPPLEMTIANPADIVLVTPPVGGLITYVSIKDWVKQRAKTIAEEESAEVEEDLGEAELEAAEGF